MIKSLIFFPLFILVLSLHNLLRCDSPFLLCDSTHPASPLPLQVFLGGSDDSLTHETLVILPVRLAQGAIGCFVYPEELVRTYVMQPTRTGEFRTSLALITYE